MSGVPFLPTPDEIIVEWGSARYGLVPEIATGSHTEHDDGGAPHI